MPRFHFKVSDSTAKIRRGSLEASNHQEATEIIENRGFQILELRESSSSAPANLKLTVQPRVPRYHPGPAAPWEFRPGLLQRLEEWSLSTRLRSALGSLMLLGLLWAAATWGRGPAPVQTETAKVASPGFQRCDLELEGRVSLSGSENYEGVTLTLLLPEIPYQKSYRWTELEHPRPGYFRLKTSVESSTRPRRLLLRARAAGREGETAPIRIHPELRQLTGLWIQL